MGVGQLCTGGINQQGVCRFDFGGPVTHMNPESGQHTLVAIVSIAFGKTCGVEGRPRLLTSVAHHWHWIYSKINEK